MKPKFEEKVPYEVAAQGGRFEPVQSADIASAMEREFNKFERNQAAYRRSMQDNAQARIDNAETGARNANRQSIFAGDADRQQAQNYKDLAAFSKTAATFVQKWEEQSAKDREDGEVYDALFGGADLNTPQIKDEDEAVGIGTAQGLAVAQMAVDAEEQTGDPQAGQIVREQLGGLAQGVANERALLMQAQAAYPGWLSSYLASDAEIQVGDQKLPIRAAAMSTDPRIRQLAITQGRFAFIRSMGLGQATKRNVVKYLAQQMITTETSLSGSLGRASIKQEREGNIRTQEGIAYEAAQNGSAQGAQATYNEVSSQLFIQNTGLTRGEASDRAFSAVVKGYVEAGNIDALEALRDVQKVPGQAGTEFGRTHGREIDEAIKQAQDAVKTNRSRQVTLIEQQMYQQLAPASSTQEREQIVRAAAEQMRAAGAWKEADALLGNFEALNQPGGIEINDARTLEAVTNGEITSQAQLDQLRQSEQITPQGYTAATRALQTISDSKPSNNPLINRQVDSYGDAFDVTFLAAVGIKKDQNGYLSVDPKYGESPIISVADAEVVREQARADMTRVANEIRRLNAGVSESKMMELIHKGLREWTTNNVNTPGGKYYIGDLIQLNSSPTVGDQKATIQANARNRLRDLLASPGVMSQVRGVVEPFKPREFQQQISVGQAVPPSVVRDYNPLRRDFLFDSDQVKLFAEQWDAGKPNSHLIAVAQQLGKSPLAVLNQQLNAYGLPMKLPSLTAPSIPVNPDKDRNANDPSVDADGNVVRVGDQVGGYTGQPASGQGGAVGDMRSGTNALMSLGFPSKGAAYLAGNIQQESGWYGQRKPWDDVGAPAGGLVSWRAERLRAIEAKYGKPISQITDAQQLEYLHDEMRRNYPNAYRIFMNPLATDRQLRRASFEFWRYGEEGARFTYAQEAYTQVR